jgi:hypothetical protein
MSFKLSIDFDSLDPLPDEQDWREDSLIDMARMLQIDIKEFFVDADGKWRYAYQGSKDDLHKAIRAKLSLSNSPRKLQNSGSTRSNAKQSGLKPHRHRRERIIFKTAAERTAFVKKHHSSLKDRKTVAAE